MASVRFIVFIRIAMLVAIGPEFVTIGLHTVCRPYTNPIELRSHLEDFLESRTVCFFCGRHDSGEHSDIAERVGISHRQCA